MQERSTLRWGSHTSVRKTFEEKRRGGEAQEADSGRRHHPRGIAQRRAGQNEGGLGASGLAIGDGGGQQKAHMHTHSMTGELTWAMGG